MGFVRIGVLGKGFWGFMEKIEEIKDFVKEDFGDPRSLLSDREKLLLGFWMWVWKEGNGFLFFVGNGDMNEWERLWKCITTFFSSLLFWDGKRPSQCVFLKK